jgi:organic radical activating enzyme
MQWYNLILNVISACTLSCEHCGQGSWRNNDKKYQISIDQVKQLLDINKLSDYNIKELIISGGEPTIWKDLEPCLELFKEYKGMIKTITLFSNGTRPINDNILKNINKLIISLYRESDIDNIMEIKQKCIEFGVKFKLKNKDKFYPWPKDKVIDSVPGECVCQFLSLLGDEISVCGEIFEIEKRYNLDVSSFKSKVEVGFLNKFNNVKFGHFDICSYCIENVNVQKYLGKVLNKSN